jgi:hypothetical protein
MTSSVADVADRDGDSATWSGDQSGRGRAVIGVRLTDFWCLVSYASSLA